mmetsp:Transcript_89372/g.208061  ORF Transcript_89372/g.208061 Transcript_89372/m.208061 type:complete len:241 (-) Transcript_89372:283-1005(-)
MREEIPLQVRGLSSHEWCSMRKDDGKRGSQFALTGSLKHLPHCWTSPTSERPSIGKPFHELCVNKVSLEADLKELVPEPGHYARNSGRGEKERHGCPLLVVWCRSLQDDAKRWRGRGYQRGNVEPRHHEEDETAEPLHGCGMVAPLNEALRAAFQEQLDVVSFVHCTAESHKHEERLHLVLPHPAFGFEHQAKCVMCQLPTSFVLHTHLDQLLVCVRNAFRGMLQSCITKVSNCLLPTPD